MVYEPRAGEGAKANILTKTIYPCQSVEDATAQSTVTLIAERTSISTGTCNDATPSMLKTMRYAIPSNGTFMSLKVTNTRISTA
jgi:uncharacterized protein YfaP (DUF2135 family)